MQEDKNENAKTSIVEKSYNFALEIIKLVRLMPKESVGFVLGKQLAASGTSIAANVEEAQGAFSRSDFIYKMQVAFKESLETNLWLRLIRDSELLSSDAIDALLKESCEIKNILGRIVKTSKENTRD